MTRNRVIVRAALVLCIAAPLAAQQPGSVTAPAAPKAAVSAPMAPVGIMVDRIVALVGAKPILLSEVMDAIFTLKSAGHPIPDPTDTAAFNLYARDTVLNDIIDQEVLIQVAKQYKSEVDDKEITPDVDKRLKELHSRYKSDAEFRTALKGEGFGTETELRNILLENRRRDLLQQQAMDSLRAHGKLAAPVNVTEADITAAFEKAKGKIGARPAEVAFKQIVIAPKANAANRAAAKAKAESLLVVLQKGGDFETTAKKESMDPGSKDLGGALPSVRRGKMVEAFDRALFSGAPPGTIYPVVVETPFGFHIIRIDRVAPAEVKSSHILIVPKIDSADVSHARLVADTVIQKWRSGVPYDTLAKYYHDGDELKSWPLSPVDSTLPEEYRNAFEGVKKGQLTQPFPIPNPRTGMPKYVVVMITDRQEAGDFTIADVRDKVREQLTQERQFRRMMDQLRREQFVKIVM
ncbi:MAG TPA: peptidylprolyl isomerase [Gemmatimonadaceae bacterium]|jgi:parvulin-like peptidyl-prolyl isomerase|nr:peptidylprolyl isomerase [Gemmatimonadaceae bacterium]